METTDSISALRGILGSRREKGKTISFVPTMGALHKGHKSCIDIARSLADVLVVSLFVNPTQFGPGEDLNSYPRPIDRDLGHCRDWGCDVVFLPTVDEMYPIAQDIWVSGGRLSKPLCGRARLDHFRGVATVVAKLFNIVQPDVAVFGQKDAQQALVIREMVRQLHFPVELRLSPIVREADGLAVSSRNAYLRPAERVLATGLYGSLCHGRDAVIDGERDPVRLCQRIRETLCSGGILNVEYVEVLRVEGLVSPETLEGRFLLAAAVHVGSTRLIDNLVIEVGPDGGVSEVELF